MPLPEILLFVLTLLLSAFFSGSETAYVASNRLKIRLSFRDTDKSFSTATLLQSDQRFLSTTLVGNNIVMVACSSLAIAVFSAFINEALLVISTTMFLLIFGEIFPKSITSQMPNRSLRLFIHLLTFFYFLFYPMIWLAEKLSRLLVGLINKQAESTKIFSKYDLLVLVREYSSRSTIGKHHQRMLARAVKFREKKLWDVMIPRTEIVGVEEGDSLDDIKSTFKESGYSRLPVYKGGFDNIIGFFYVLDFYRLEAQELPELRKPFFLPESINVVEALRKMQAKRVSIAVIVDEHGGTAGLVTTEDIVEKLVGSIYDEFDLQQKHVQLSGESTLIVDGKTSVDELRDRYRFNIPEGDYVTIAGLITDTLGRIPRPGESVDFDSFKIKVLDAGETKILKVWMTKKPKAKNEKDDQHTPK